MNKVVESSAVFLTIIAAACASPEQSTLPPGPNIPIVRLRAEPYSFEFNSGLNTPARLVVRDQAAWQLLWAQIYQGRSPVPPVPTIDFSRDMLVVAALGVRSSGGYVILIDGASGEGPNVTVAVRSISPGQGCGVTAALTQPVDIARLPRRDGDVRFLERAEVRACDWIARGLAIVYAHAGRRLTIVELDQDF